MRVVVVKTSCGWRGCFVVGLNYHPTYCCISSNAESKASAHISAVMRMVLAWRRFMLCEIQRPSMLRTVKN